MCLAAIRSSFRKWATSYDYNWWQNNIVIWPNNSIVNLNPKKPFDSNHACTVLVNQLLCCEVHLAIAFKLQTHCAKFSCNIVGNQCSEPCHEMQFVECNFAEVENNLTSTTLAAILRAILPCLSTPLATTCTNLLKEPTCGQYLKSPSRPPTMFWE